MSATPAGALPAPTRMGRSGVLWGVLLCLPRLVLAWFLLGPAFDALQLVTAFLLIGGLLVLGVGLFRLLLVARPGRRLWPFALGGFGAVLLAGLVTTWIGTTGAAQTVGEDALITPVPVVLYQYAWTLVGALWVIGFVFLFGAPLLALARRRIRLAPPPASAPPTRSVPPKKRR